MINKEDIQSLANLARIELTQEELSSMTTELDSILSYVGQIQNATGELSSNIPLNRNVMREDVVTNGSREYTEKILKNAPSRDGDYLRVKKIL